MSNSTVPFAEAVHGTNPQFLIEKITRLKIYNSVYWKEHCFGITAESTIDKAVSLKYCGGVYGGINKPTNFLCLVLKLLQLQPEKDIIVEYIKNEDFKYLRALGAFYLRLTGKAEEVYEYLEPLYNDYRKISYRTAAGWKLSHMDEFVDGLLTEETMCDITLPHLPKRLKLEQTGVLEPRRSVLEDEFEEMQETQDRESAAAAPVQSAAAASGVAASTDVSDPPRSDERGRSRSPVHGSPRRSPPEDRLVNSRRDRSPRSSPRRRGSSRGRHEDRYDDRDRDRSHRHRARSRSRDRGRHRGRDRSHSRERSYSSRNKRRSHRDRSRSNSSYSSRDSYHGRDRRGDRRRSRYRSSSRSRSRDRKRSRGSDRRSGRRRSSSSHASDRSKTRDSRADRQRSRSHDSADDLPSADLPAKHVGKKDADKLFDRMFKKSKSSKSGGSTRDAKELASKVVEGSVEYWNEIRSQQGLKPLRE